MAQRELSTCAHKWHNRSCKKCGVYEYLHDSALKTNLFDSYLNCSSSKYIKHMRRRRSEPVEVKQITESTALLIDAICEKFEYGLETRTLGMYIFGKTCQNQQTKEKFWAATSLMVASKGIELDKRVPYLNRYQRYADKSFPQEDYQLAEKIIFKAMNFDIQYSTFTSFLHFYMTAGVIFQSDNVSEGEVKAIEDQLLLKAKIWLRHGAFLKYQPESLAISIIKEVRIKYQLDPWNQYMENISGIKDEDVRLIEKFEVLRTLNMMQIKNRQKTISASHNTSFNTYQSKKSSILASIKNTISTENDAKITKICREKYKNTLRLQNNQTFKENCVVKENALKIVQPLSSTLRSQNYSISKMSLTSSTDRIIPFNMFASRR